MGDKLAPIHADVTTTVKLVDRFRQLLEAGISSTCYALRLPPALVRAEFAREAQRWGHQNDSGAFVPQPDVEPDFDDEPEAWPEGTR